MAGRGCGHRFPHEPHSHSSKEPRGAPGAFPLRSCRTCSDGPPAKAGTTSADPQRGQSGSDAATSAVRAGAARPGGGAPIERPRVTTAGRRRRSDPCACARIEVGEPCGAASLALHYPGHGETMNLDPRHAPRRSSMHAFEHRGPRQAGSSKRSRSHGRPTALRRHRQLESWVDGSLSSRQGTLRARRSAIWTAFRAAPLRRLSPQANSSSSSS